MCHAILFAHLLVYCRVFVKKFAIAIACEKQNKKAFVIRTVRDSFDVGCNCSLYISNAHEKCEAASMCTA